MPAPFGTGEITSRLRRLLDLRGQFPMQIDETIVPVAMVQDISQLPFRRSGRRWFTFLQSAPGAGVRGYIEIANETTSFFSLDRVRADVANIGITAQEIALTFGASILTGAVGLAQTFEVMQPGAVFERAPITLRIQTGDPAGDADFMRAVGIPTAAGNLVAVNFPDELDIAVPPGASIFVVNVALNSVMNVSLSGRFWDDVSRNTQT